MKNFNILAILMLIFFTACGTTQKSTISADALHSSWVLQNENEPEIGLSDEPITIIFNENELSSISGFAGCNYYGGTYHKNQAQLSFSDLHSTKRACPSLEVEQEYLNLLPQVDTFEIIGKNLYLYKGKLLLLHFKK